MAKFPKGDNMENCIARLPFLTLILAFLLSACGGSIDLPEGYQKGQVWVLNAEGTLVPFGRDQCLEYYEDWVELPSGFGGDKASTYYHQTWTDWDAFCKTQHYILSDSCPKSAAVKKAADCPKCPQCPAIGSTLPGAPSGPGTWANESQATMPWPTRP